MRRPISFRRTLVGGIVVLVLCASGLIWLNRVERDSRGAAPAAKSPAYVVTAEDEQVVVRSTSDGEVVRVLADVTEARGLSSVATSPDGSQVYFARNGAVCSNGVGRSSEIVRMPIAGGPLEVVVRGGMFPAISPDGDSMAYLSQGNGGCGSKQVVVVRSLRSDDEREISGTGGGDRAMKPLSWSPDGHRILAEGLPPVWHTRQLFVIGVTRNLVGLDEVRSPSDAGAFQGPGAFADTGTVIAPVRIGGEISIERFDPFGGTVRERLFVSPRSADDSGGSAQVWPEYLRVDKSGRYLLLAVDAQIGYQLFVWSKAQGLKKIADARLRDVAWANA